MKDGIHPNYQEVKVQCSCGNAFTTRSVAAAKGVMQIEICAACHPYYTGKQKVLDVGGRVDKFKKRYATKAA